MGSQYPGVGGGRFITKLGSSGAAQLGSATATANSFGVTSFGTIFTTSVPTVITSLFMHCSVTSTATLSQASSWSATITASSATASLLGEYKFTPTSGSFYFALSAVKDIYPALHVPSGVAVSASASVSQTPFANQSIYIALFGLPASSIEGS